MIASEFSIYNQRSRQVGMHTSCHLNRPEWPLPGQRPASLTVPIEPIVPSVVKAPEPSPAPPLPNATLVMLLACSQVWQWAHLGPRPHAMKYPPLSDKCQLSLLARPLLMASGCDSRDQPPTAVRL